MTMTGGESAQSVLAQWFNSYGLSSLAGWAYEKLAAGASIDEIMLELTDRPEYEARFPAMKTLQQQGRAVNEAQYIAYENAVRGIMRNAGLPAGFYDQPADFAGLFVNDLSVAEVEQRVGVAYERVAFAPDDVKAAFAEMYGAGSNDALAAFMLDPDRAQPIIQKQVAAAEMKAQAGRYGLGITQQTAETLATGVTPEQGAQAIRAAGQLRPLTEQTVMEEQTGMGLSTEELLAGTSGLAPQDKIKKTLEARVAQFQGQGGAVQSQQGIIGLGGSQK